MAVADITVDSFAAFPLVDASVTDGLRAAVGDAVDQIVAKSATVLDDRLAELAGLAASPLEDRVARLGHEIGGMAGQVGLTRLAKASLRLETVCRNGDANEASALIAQIGTIGHETRALLPV